MCVCGSWKMKGLLLNIYDFGVLHPLVTPKPIEKFSAIQQTQSGKMDVKIFKVSLPELTYFKYLHRHDNAPKTLFSQVFQSRHPRHVPHNVFGKLFDGINRFFSWCIYFSASGWKLYFVHFRSTIFADTLGLHIRIDSYIWSPLGCENWVTMSYYTGKNIKSCISKERYFTRNFIENIKWFLLVNHKFLKFSLVCIVIYSFKEKASIGQS